MPHQPRLGSFHHQGAAWEEPQAIHCSVVVPWLPYQIYNWTRYKHLVNYGTSGFNVKHLVLPTSSGSMEMAHGCHGWWIEHVKHPVNFELWKWPMKMSPVYLTRNPWLVLWLSIAMKHGPWKYGLDDKNNDLTFYNVLNMVISQSHVK